MQLDATDLKILDRLQRDASLTNQALAEQVHTSPATCLRRVKALVDAGVIERRVALLSPEALGHGLTAIVEVTLDRQSARVARRIRVARGRRDARSSSAIASRPVPTSCSIVQVADMAAYHALVERLFTQDANVRNVKAFFSVRRAKFETRIALPAAPGSALEDDQALQVLAFRKVDRHRVIGARRRGGHG